MDGGSLFTDDALWTKEGFDQLRRRFVDAADQTGDSFIEKLERQLQSASSDAKCLWAEMAWAYWLISMSLKPATKVGRIHTVWQWSGRPLPDNHRLLSDEVLAGVANTGRGYTSAKWFEYCFFILAMSDWFDLSRTEREALLDDPWRFAAWLHRIEGSDKRMFRHAILFLLFPDYFEPIVSRHHKAKIVLGLHEGTEDVDLKDHLATDKAILAIRERLEGEHSGEVDFYAPSIRASWDPPDGGDGAAEWFRQLFPDARRVWVANIVKGDGERWSRYLRDGVISIGWIELGDLRRFESREAIQEVVPGMGATGKSPMRSLFLWQFCHEVGEGDVIVATASANRVLGYGIVEGEYDYIADSWGHVRPVRWTPCEPPPDLPKERRVSSKLLTDVTERMDWVRFALELGDLPPPNGARPVRHALNTILYGPPGTGKTWHTVTRAVGIVEGREVSEVAHEDRPAVKLRFEEHRDAGRIEMVTFHQNTTYEDFVEGIRPILSGPRERDAQPTPERGDAVKVQYKMSRGVFRRIAERAAADPDVRFVLIIDEINRGNIARIFGELITLIEDSKRIGQHDEARVMLPGSKTEFAVPANLHVLGTMNTADRSIALLDTALRRRFVFEEMMPEPFHSGVANDLDGVDCGELLTAMNRRIAVLLDREHQIGHTYLLHVDTLPTLASTFQNRIMPLLQEYFYDDWEKIRAVLNNNGFVRKSDPPEELVRLNLVDRDRAVCDLAPADDDRWTNPNAYRKIYGNVSLDDDDPV